MGCKLKTGFPHGILLRTPGSFEAVVGHISKAIVPGDGLSRPMARSTLSAEGRLTLPQVRHTPKDPFPIRGAGSNSPARQDGAVRHCKHGRKLRAVFVVANLAH